METVAEIVENHLRTELKYAFGFGEDQEKAVNHMVDYIKEHYIPKPHYPINYSDDGKPELQAVHYGDQPGILRRDSTVRYLELPIDNMAFDSEGYFTIEGEDYYDDILNRDHLVLDPNEFAIRPLEKE